MPTSNVAETVRVALGAHAYSIHIGSGLLSNSSAFADVAGSTCAVVTNETIAPLFAARLERTLASCGRKPVRIVLPDGEQFKDWATLQRVFDGLAAARCDRQSVLFALGGGVVGDITGFAAACYMRGIPYVQVPTTLLSQVDSSVGGKTGINLAAGKNLIGAFHQPLAVVVDIDTLSSLPERDFVSGLAEVIKYGVMADPAFFSWIEENLSLLLARDAATLTQAVRRCCEIKAHIVEEDEREAGSRAFLNLGHTFAHAIETGAGYGEWLHGEAVGCGIAMAADLSVRCGSLARPDAQRIEKLLSAARLPIRAPKLGFERYRDLMILDKKASGGQARFVLLHALGQPRLSGVPDACLAETLEVFCG